jgi:hypothetical protein
MKLFPDAVFCVSEKQASDYTDQGATVIEHPDTVQGSAMKYQWVLDNLEGPIFMIDDDVSKVWTHVGRVGRRITDTEAIDCLIYNAAHCAIGAGTPMFGFSQFWDVRKFRGHEPFLTGAWVGSSWGFLDRSMSFDPKILLHCDVNMSLSVLVKNRFIWRDNRFAFICDRNDMPGGNSLYRSSEKEDQEQKYMLNKWGKYITFRMGKSREIVRLNVDRRAFVSLKNIL